MRKKVFFLTIAIIYLIISSSWVFSSQSSVTITQDEVVSDYDADIYIISYKVKNYNNFSLNDIVVTCNIVDGYGNVLNTQYQTINKLIPYGERKGEFHYFRPDKSFQIFHKLLIK